jgi:hypothetical protein
MTFKPPRDLARTVDMFTTFTEHEPRDIGVFAERLALPEAMGRVGKGLWVAYRSDKWTGKMQNYIHEHEAPFPSYYFPNAKGGGRRASLPGRPKSLAMLGQCLGWSWQDSDGNVVEAEITKPYPELYCSPNGKVLFVISNKSRLECACWGGGLVVEDRGIVG